MCPPQLSPQLSHLVGAVEEALQSLPQQSSSFEEKDNSLGIASWFSRAMPQAFTSALPESPPIRISCLPQHALQKLLNPVLEALESLDTRSLLRMQSTLRTCSCKIFKENGGCSCYDDLAILYGDYESSSGIASSQDRLRHYVHPIHDDISPSMEVPCIRYLHGYEKENKFSMGIFVFPPGATMPLHDHPGMCVVSKVLYGEIRSKSYDLIGPTGGVNGYKAFGPRERILAAPNTTILYPKMGNVHEFTAGPCGAALLDILLPPYDDDRDCTFYETKRLTTTTQSDRIDDDIEFDESRGRIRPNCILVPVPSPPGFKCIGGEYGFFLMS
mmetsp:Transcript_40644/g.95432  ORF Transcript_40644/g.95432 Transcript_40644/m.95432 type:complete len:329 (-) Transcript_40644:309-1295(-)|eukprot:CAMPEP_0113298666 /NCGR_PEP_ID=MMETSP0010_2-20120614/1017_1 /TAXON_ID=216773 ORGANISM="Corethron hystrix, Strain 308" /NCGR_SAMPLE_ID=MMETSP0010_2 /ASSEMBLY_ACC=CAM_ASM_000155 /LENGTH=328 /DNA_ID=CAMNT_0000151761 /DNA_START=30 /DNA_END=1016 /DNA_ORIENTATION=+ /assembly_acc=CAM_ASM_000155